MDKLFIGSCVDCSIGIGYILMGSEIRRTNDGWELLTDDGWVECYDVMKVEGSVESPLESDLT